VISALGGKAAKTELVEDNTGTEYIVKEGIEGEEVYDYDGDFSSTVDTGIEVAESAVETMSAAYFVGNEDLHGGNMIVSSTNELVIIDHDSAGFAVGGGGTPMHIDMFADELRGSLSPSSQDQEYAQKVKKRIYDKSFDVMRGVDLNVPDGSGHQKYAKEAARDALRGAYVSDEYDISEEDEEYLPDSVSQPPQEILNREVDIETMDDFPDPEDNSYDVEYVANDTGGIRSAEVQSIVEVRGKTRMMISNMSTGVITDPNRITSIIPKHPNSR